MGKPKKVFISFIIILAIIWGIINVGSVIFALYGMFVPQNTPQITYGEFPFYVEYEMDGERYVIEDTIICEFDGYDSSAWFAKPRTWNIKLKSGDESKCVLNREENTQSILTPKRINLRSALVIDYGSPEYYMDDPNGWSMIDKEASFEYREYWKASEKVYDTENTKLNKKELEKYFGIKIIKFEFSKPIKNKF